MCGAIQRASQISSDLSTLDFQNIRAAELTKVFEYCEFHNRARHSEGNNEADVQSFDNRFVQMERGLLFAVTNAAHYLDVKPLLDLCWFVFNLPFVLIINHS